MKFRRNTMMAYLGAHLLESFLTPSKDPVYDSAVFDSREVVNGIIFIAIDGQKSAGVNYVEDAISRGATCIVANISYREELDSTIKAHNENVDFLLVDNSLLVYGLLGQLAREQFPGEVIGVIGSVGKTTTKNMLRELGGGQLLAHASRGSYNNQTGVPLTLCAIPETAERAIVELGESHFGDLTYITNFAQPTIVVITNVAEAHTEFLGDLLGVAKTMNETVSLVKESGTIIVPFGITHKDIVLENSRARIIYIVEEASSNHMDMSLVKNADIATISQVTARADLTHDFVLEFGDHKVELHVPLVGKHFVIDAALAAVASIIAGTREHDLAPLLENVSAQGHRMRVISTGKLTIVDDCYNANPASMKASMQAVAEMARTANFGQGRSIFIMGPMRELGSESDRFHAELGHYAHEVGIDVLVCVDEATYPGSIEEIHPDSYYFETVQECCEKISSIVENRDIVGVKASRGSNPDHPAMVPIVEILTELK